MTQADVSNYLLGNHSALQQLADARDVQDAIREIAKILARDRYDQMEFRRKMTAISNYILEARLICSLHHVLELSIDPDERHICHAPSYIYESLPKRQVYPPMGILERLLKDRTQGTILEDIAEIVASSNRSEVRNSVLRYISKLSGLCPTLSCHHHITEGVFDCYGYETQREVIHLDAHVPKIEAVRSNPLVINMFCSIFYQLHQGKEPCKTCRDEGFRYKVPLMGLYCHGCGFFVDYDRGMVGYSKEWTANRQNLTVLGTSCVKCGRQGVSVKFGDYWFCNDVCMQKWYLSLEIRKEEAFPH